jgi:hypothetical protein
VVRRMDGLISRGSYRAECLNNRRMQPESLVDDGVQEREFVSELIMRRVRTGKSCEDFRPKALLEIRLPTKLD